LELFDKFSIVELPIPKNLKKIQDTTTFRGFRGCTYKCTKFYKKYRTHLYPFKLKVGTTNVSIEDLIRFDGANYGSWEIFDKYINNEEEYLKNITKDSFEYDSYNMCDLCIEGEIMYEKERILKWYAEELGYGVGIMHGDFCRQYDFYRNLRFAAYEKKIISGRCIKYEYGNYKNWEKCLPPSQFYEYAIDPQFIFDEIWRAIIIAEPFDGGDDIAYDYDTDYYDGGVLKKGTYFWEKMEEARKEYEK